MTRERAICIHGHFYQPPRENPWREQIETQDSATPFHDWNERITAECYAPCARARLLDAEGQMRRTLNAYARMSFNVGPTLLSWMEEAAPNTYKAILDADRESETRFDGHGAAIAQAYGHAILPLASRRDKVTQVRWGLRDFESRFGRRAEALWLPETAVDIETLEVLAAEGMRYVILAPHQIRRIRPTGSAAWRDVDAATLDTTVPYEVPLPSGASIVTFAYDGGIAHGVSFGDLLGNGDRFLARLLSALPRDGGLVHIATDGETYGHHHRFGEMALAYAFDRLEAERDVRLTNYAAWLDENPPENEAEIVPNTSWSCAHGVERWRSDCGCTTYSKPGWNQAWRAPLRRAVDGLQDRLDEIYVAQAASLFRDPWAARDAYIDVVLDPKGTDRFLDAQSAQPLGAHERTEALRLLEMQRHRLLASTSCGWYFADLAGIETIQILQYAARAIELAESLGARGVEVAFLDELAPARSNDSAYGDAREIYERSVRSAAVDPLRAVKEGAVSALYDLRPLLASSPGIAVDVLEQRERGGAESRLVVGRARTTTGRTRETLDIVYAAVCGGSGGPHAGSAVGADGDAAGDLVRLFDEAGADAAANRIAESFPAPVRIEDILSPRALADLETDAAAGALESIEDDAASFALLDDPRIAHSGPQRGLALFALSRRLDALAGRLDALAAMADLLARAKAASLPVSGGALAHELGRTITRELRWPRPHGLSMGDLDMLERAAMQARALAPDVNLWWAQEAYMDAVRLEAGALVSPPLREAFDRVGKALGVRLPETNGAARG